jgi:hypothetical protein
VSEELQEIAGIFVEPAKIVLQVETRRLRFCIYQKTDSSRLIRQEPGSFHRIEKHGFSVPLSSEGRIDSHSAQQENRHFFRKRIPQFFWKLSTKAASRHM